MTRISITLAAATFTVSFTPAAQVVNAELDQRVVAQAASDLQAIFAENN